MICQVSLVALCLLAVGQARPAAEADVDELPPYVGGPIAKVYKQLGAEQKTEVDALLKGADKDTKAAFHNKMEAFTAKLDKKLQDVLNKDKAQFEKFKTDIRDKSKKLGKEGKELFDGLKANFENQDQTFEQEHDQLVKLVKGASKEALDQFRKANIPLPPVNN